MMMLSATSAAGFPGGLLALSVPVMVKLPDVSKERRPAPVEEAMYRGVVVPEAWINKLADGSEVPMPTLPFAKTVKGWFGK